MSPRTRDTTLLAVGSAGSGLLAYVFFALVTRALGSDGAAPVSVLWAWWSFAGAALTFPFQHWIARSVAAQRGERSVREVWRLLAGLAAGVAVVATGLAWLARDQLFPTRTDSFALLVGAVALCAAATGVVRGVLSARHRFAAVGAGLLAENAVRCLAALGLVVGGVDDPLAYGLSLLAGYAAAIGWPSAFRLSRDGDPGRSRTVLGFLGGASGGQLLAQTVLTGGPVVLALAGGAPAQVTALFAGLALFRAPYTLALGLVAMLTGRLTGLVVARREAALGTFRLGLVGATLLGTPAAAGLGAWLGPELIRLIFGSGVSLDSTLTLVLAAGSAVALGNLVAGIMLLARGRAPSLVGAWPVAIVAGTAWFALAPGSALARTCASFLVVEAVAFCLLLAAEVRAARAAARAGG